MLIQFLHANFELIKNCLLKVSDLEKGMGEQKGMLERLSRVEKETENNKTLFDNNTKRIEELKNSIGEDIMVSIK